MCEKVVYLEMSVKGSVYRFNSLGFIEGLCAVSAKQLLLLFWSCFCYHSWGNTWLTATLAISLLLPFTFGLVHLHDYAFWEYIVVVSMAVQLLLSYLGHLGHRGCSYRGQLSLAQQKQAGRAMGIQLPSL